MLKNDRNDKPLLFPFHLLRPNNCKEFTIFLANNHNFSLESSKISYCNVALDLENDDDLKIDDHLKKDNTKK